MTTLTDFAEACYNQNSMEELRDALRERRADPDDCRTWRITPTQWREAIKAALAERIAVRHNTDGTGETTGYTAGTGGQA